MARRRLWDAALAVEVSSPRDNRAIALKRNGVFPAGGSLDVTAPLPPHMQQSWNLLGFASEGLAEPDDER